MLVLSKNSPRWRLYLKITKANYCHRKYTRGNKPMKVPFKSYRILTEPESVGVWVFMLMLLLKNSSFFFYEFQGTEYSTHMLYSQVPTLNGSHIFVARKNLGLFFKLPNWLANGGRFRKPVYCLRVDVTKISKSLEKFYFYNSAFLKLCPLKLGHSKLF